jgi:sodium-independent sulfate anion transporter 11
MEHITIAKAIAGTSRVDATQEMITIGLSNLIGAFCNSMPITGSFSRTMVNHASGVATPMGGIVTGVLVILSLQFLTPYFYYIPNAALASVIVCAVIFTVDIGIIRPMWKSKRKCSYHTASGLRRQLRPRAKT